jgi:hypothetical protein
MKQNPYSKDCKRIILLILLAALAAALAPGQASAESIYASEVVLAVGEGADEVVGLYPPYLTYALAQPDGGEHALGGPPDFCLYMEGLGASGWIEYAGSMVLRFDTFLEDGAGTDLTVHHWGEGSTTPGTSDTVVSVSSDGNTWIPLGPLNRYPSYSCPGASTGFDFSAQGVDRIHLVRIEKNATCAPPVGNNCDCDMFIDAVEGHYPGILEQPTVTLASGDPTETSLTPGFFAMHWDPGSGYVHTRSQWQISGTSAFSTLVMESDGATHLTSFEVPLFLLETETDYACRVRFYDDQDTPSEWSEPFSFRTAAASTGQAVYASGAVEAVGGKDSDGTSMPVVRDQKNVWPSYQADGGQSALGPPDYDILDGSGLGGYASGWSDWGGHLILSFDQDLTDMPGTDLIVYHWGPGARNSDHSTSFIYAGRDGDAEWTLLGELSQSDRGVITTDSYDFEESGVSDPVNLVKIVKNYNGSDEKLCGKYIDAMAGNPALGLVPGPDTDGNGIPDEQEVDSTVDLNENGIPDINEPDRIKCVNTAVGEGQMCVEIPVNSNATEILSIYSIDPAAIADSTGRPENLALGIVSFKVRVNAPGAEAQVVAYLSASLPADTGWYKYDGLNGWQDHSEDAVFEADGSVTLTLQDGGVGDADITANSVIVDPAGPGLPPGSVIGGEGAGYAVTMEGTDADTAAAGGCFISTVIGP